MDNLLPLLLGGVAIFLLVVILRDPFSYEAKVKRALRTAPLCTIVTFPENSVGTVQGKVCYFGGAPLVAPISGRPCAYYEAIVEEWRSQGGKGINGSWCRVIRDHRGQDFLLDDGQGKARVMMRSATVHLVKDVHFLSGGFENGSPVLGALLAISNPNRIKNANFDTAQEAAPMLAAFLSRHGYESKGRIFRYREGVLEADEIVTVCGCGTLEADRDPRSATSGYRELAMRLVLDASPHVPLYVSDDMPALR